MSNAEQIYADLSAAIEEDRLILPTMPEAALRVREVAESPDSCIADLCEVISQDAALTARIIKVVNSPLMRASREIKDLQSAVNRLGMKYTCNLATGLAMEQMFQATDDNIDRMMRTTWTSSTEIAGICYALCKEFTKLKPDQALLAGLMHKIGILPILTYIEEFGGPTDSFSLQSLVETIHPRLGSKILRTWDFPEEIAMVPEAYADFSRDSGDACYADLVTVASLHQLADTNHPWTELDWSQIPAFRNLGIDPASLSEEEDLSAEMEAAMALLAG